MFPALLQGLGKSIALCLQGRHIHWIPCPLLWTFACKRPGDPLAGKAGLEHDLPAARV